jgi:FG-GAP repeat protein
VSELADIDRDGANDIIVGDPNAEGFAGVTWVYSGATGEVLHRFPGAPNDNLGFAVADAGDTDGDRVHDIIAGGPGNDTTTTPGVAHLYSGRTGRLLRLFRGRELNDQLGAAVASAGDQDGDRRADVLVGAPGVDANGADSGRAYVYGVRRYRPLRVLDGADAGDAFGAGTDWTPDATGDRVPDLIVGAPAAGPLQNGAVHLFSGRTGRERWRALAPPTGVNLGRFFVAGVGDVDGDRVPDVYGADYGDASLGPATGRAALYSGVDGHELQSFTGAASRAGLGPGREAGFVDRDRRPDLAIGSYSSSAGAPGAGLVELYAPDGRLLRTITSTTAGESLGFDAVGIGDVDGDRRGDLLLSAADGQTVYVVAGERVP